MNISSMGSPSTASLDSEYSVAVAKKALDAQKLEGQNALQLIQSAAKPAPLQPGQTFSAVM